MAANQTFPNAGKVVSSPPQLTCVPAHLVQAFPPQGSKPTVDNVVAVSRAVQVAATYCSVDPTLKAEYANALVYQSSVLQSAWGTGPIGQLDLIQQSIDNLKTEMNARFDSMNARFDLLDAQRAADWAKAANNSLLQEKRANTAHMFAIPKYIQAVGQGLPDLPAGIPAPEVGTSLPISEAEPLPDFHLPALSINVNLTLHQIRLIEAWYGENFRLNDRTPRALANKRLLHWMVGSPLI